MCQIIQLGTYKYQFVLKSKCQGDISLDDVTIDYNTKWYHTRTIWDKVNYYISRKSNAFFSTFDVIAQ